MNLTCFGPDVNGSSYFEAWAEFYALPHPNHTRAGADPCTGPFVVQRFPDVHPGCVQSNSRRSYSVTCAPGTKTQSWTWKWTEIYSWGYNLNIWNWRWSWGYGDFGWGWVFSR